MFDGKGIEIDLVDVRLQVTRGGPAARWLGPALRGLLLRPLRERVCSVAPMPETCTGCPAIPDCPYGSAFEQSESQGPKGRRDPFRPVVLQPGYPMPDQLEPGQSFGLRIKQVRGVTPLMIPLLLETLDEAGGTRGLGRPGGIRFRVGSLASTSWRLEPRHLPLRMPDDDAIVPALRVLTDSPLLLDRESPDLAGFEELLRAAVRTVSHALTAFDRPVEADFPGLCSASAEVPLEGERSRHVFQPRRRSRDPDHAFRIRGIEGEYLFRDVPAALLPWLVWGGRLNVGRSRAFGAGAYHVVLD